MTAKRKPRGTRERLEALEEKRAARVQAVEEVRGAKTRLALDGLDVGTLEALKAHGAIQDEDGPAWARFVEVARLLTPLFPDSVNPARAGALRWADATEEVPDGVPFPVPDNLPDFVAYFDEEARNCEAALSGLDVASLPAGVTPEEARQVFRYARAGWRLWASHGRVLIEWGDV